MANTVDQMEKLGRFVLWISIAIVFALVPLTLYNRDKQAAKDAEQARIERERERTEQAKERAADEEAKRPVRLTLDSMGDLIRGLDGAVGHVYFTNASSREGIVCISGIASNAGQRTESLAACQHVGPYESNVKMSLMFAGGDLKAICPNTPCQFSVKDTPVSEPPRVAAASVVVPRAPGH